MSGSSGRFLVVPGWGGSSKHHWQTHLEASLDGASRVEMRDWLTPHAAQWIATLEKRIAEGPPPIVVGHSLGCIAIAHAVSRGSRIRGALLVAPVDVDREDCPRVLRGFAPIPTVKFGVPLTVVASDNDAHATIAKSRELAAAWGGDLVTIHGGGHLNVASGHGPWPLARLWAQQLDGLAAAA